MLAVGSSLLCIGSGFLLLPLYIVPVASSCQLEEIDVCISAAISQDFSGLPIIFLTTKIHPPTIARIITITLIIMIFVLVVVSMDREKKTSS
jgi:hypothetical protein